MNLERKDGNEEEEIVGDTASSSPLLHLFLCTDMLRVNPIPARDRRIQGVHPKQGHVQKFLVVFPWVLCAQHSAISLNWGSPCIDVSIEFPPCLKCPCWKLDQCGAISIHAGACWLFPDIVTVEFPGEQRLDKFSSEDVQTKREESAPPAPKKWSLTQHIL